MGRKKLPTSYYDRTAVFQIRMEREVLQSFLDAFQEERAFYRGANRTLYLKNIVGGLMKGYVDGRKAAANAVEDAALLRNQLVELKANLAGIQDQIIAIQEKLLGAPLTSFEGDVEEEEYTLGEEA